MWRVAEPKIIERLDAFRGSRLVEYFDEDPWAPADKTLDMPVPMAAAIRGSAEENRTQDNSLGVTVEARFNVGEYDIHILSAKESGGLETWRRNGYKIARGANQLLKPYIRSSIKFLVAKANLDKFEELGYQFIRPLQVP